MIEDRLRKRFPDFIAHGLARKFPSRFFELSPELLVIFLPARKSDDCHSGREIAIGGEVVERRHQFVMREIASGAEDHNAARLRHGARGQTFAQRVWLRLIGGSIHGRSGNYADFR